MSCVDCGTEFPYLGFNWANEDERLCEYVECGQKTLIAKPIAGNALFWSNIRTNGSGHTYTLHAGLPVKKGEKIGLNIWTRGPEIADVGGQADV